MVQKNSLGFRPVILIGGATATGKSALAIDIAERFNGEIISADSMQIYKDFNIGTAKITADEMHGVAHHLINTCEDDKYYSVGQFKQDAERLIESILKNGKLPIVVGGTGLYLNSLLFDYQFENLEDCKKISRKYNFFPIVVELPRNELYQKINQRVDQMIKFGLIDEISQLLKKGYTFDSAPFRAIGYKEFKPYFDGEKDLSSCIENLKQDSRHYAKRQITWFKQWSDVALYAKSNEKEKIINLVKGFLENGCKN